jgi:hypothetical protein
MEPVKGLISEFLIALSVDAELLERFRDPDRRRDLYSEFGLDEHQQDVLESHDLQAIRGEILEEYLRAKVDVALYVQHVFAQHVSTPPDDGDDGSGGSSG